MSNILEELYYGNLEPIGNTRPRSDEYQKKDQQYSKNRSAFEETLKNLDDDLFQAFVRLSNQSSCLNVDEEAEAFQLGFCMGVSMMQEVSRRMESLS